MKTLGLHVPCCCAVLARYRRSVDFVKINEIYSVAFSGSAAGAAVVEAPSAAGASLESPAAGPPSVEA